MTRQPLNLSQLVSDKALENEIKHFKAQNGISEQVDDDEEEEEMTNHRSSPHAEKLSAVAIANYTRRTQKVSLERCQSERIRRMVRRAVAFAKNN